MKLSEKLELLRALEGNLRGYKRPLTKSEVARMVEEESGEKISIAYLSQLESGKRPHMTETTRELLARFYKVHPGFFVSDPEGFDPNVTSVPLTTAPSGFPGAPSQWSHMFVEHGGAVEPEPEPGRPEGYVGTWSANADYKVGDVVDRGGTYYRAKVAHGAAYAGTWGPPLPSVWDVVGPVA